MKWLAIFSVRQWQQNVKNWDIVSPTLCLNGAIQQGAILGLEAFISMVNDVKACLLIYKYLGDSTLSEIKQGRETWLLQNALDQTSEFMKKWDGNKLK